MPEIKEVRSPSDLKDFIKLPFSIYRNDPLWTPELIRDQREYFSEKNPFLRENRVRLYVAKKNGMVTGRIASIINHTHLRLHNDSTGFFGFFESVDEMDTASILFRTVEGDLKLDGLKRIMGPMNFSTNEQCGFLVEGFETPPMIMTPHTPPYYNRLAEESGYMKAKDLLAFITDVPDRLPGKVERAASIAERQGISTRRVSKKTFMEDLRAFQEIYNNSWKDNWGFVPLGDEELRFLGKKLKPVYVPEMTLVAEKKGLPVGFIGLLPDLNMVLRKMNGRLTPLSIFRAMMEYRKIRQARLLLLGIRPGFRHRGVDGLLFRDAFSHVRGRYDRVEFSWILEDNLPVIRLAEMINGQIYKRYRIYEKPL
jgi:hypothetical protein